MSPAVLRWSALPLGLIAALLCASACGPTGGETPTATTGSSAPATGLDRAAACAAFVKDIEELQGRSRALSRSAVFEAQGDPAREAKAMADLKALYAELETMVGKHVASAGDSRFKEALTAYHEQVKVRRAAMDAAGDDIGRFLFAMDDPASRAAEEKVRKVCA